MGSEPDFSDDEDFVDDISDAELMPDLLKQKGRDEGKFFFKKQPEPLCKGSTWVWIIPSSSNWSQWTIRTSYGLCVRKYLFIVP